ncbi:MAG: hypothetical protein K8I60_10140 [Anaerolineae bacterium]|nr:hypothetical protein [Anaerolineae bacterium]
MKKRIPIWINILQVVILAILSFQAFALFFNPGQLYAGLVVDDATRPMILVLAGRNVVMALISLLALIRQESRFYSFAFLMHALRELQDMFFVPLTLSGDASGGAVMIFLVFLVVFVIPEITAFFRLNKLANQPGV